MFMILFNTYAVLAAEWVQNGTIIMYKLDNGDFARDVQLKIDGKYYYFGEDGSLLTGFQMIGNGFYVFNDDGTPRTEDIKYNNKTYHVNDRGKILNINEKEFDEVEANYFAVHSYNADEELNWQTELGKNILETYPVSKYRLEWLMINALGNEYSTYKLEHVLKNVEVNWKEKAYLCAIEYLNIRDKLYLSINREQLKGILMLFEKFEHNEANYGVELAFSNLNASDDKGTILDIVELRKAFLDEIRFKTLKTGQSLEQLKALDADVHNREEKRLKTLIAYLNKFVPKLYTLSSQESTIKYAKKIGYTDAEVQKAIQKVTIDWTQLRTKLCAKVVFENPNCTKEELIGMVKQYGFAVGEATQGIEYILSNTVLVNAVNFASDSDIIKELMNVGFTEEEATEQLYLAKGNDDVLEVQTGNKEKKEKHSSGSLDAVTAIGKQKDDMETAIKNRMVTEHLFRNDLANEYDADILNKLELSEYALQYAKELQDLGFQEWQIIPELENKKFKHHEIAYALFSLGYISNTADY